MLLLRPLRLRVSLLLLLSLLLITPPVIRMCLLDVRRSGVNNGYVRSIHRVALGFLCVSLVDFLLLVCRRIVGAIGTVRQRLLKVYHVLLEAADALHHQVTKRMDGLQDVVTAYTRHSSGDMDGSCGRRTDAMTACCSRGCRLSMDIVGGSWRQC